MLLLHISDIHFRAPNCLPSNHDPDRPYRTRLLQDARELIQAHGAVDAIMIGGDVAYKGDGQEYAVAYGWIAELAEAVGCSMASVFVIPGNHDVDREMITESPTIANAQEAIARAPRERQEQTFRAQLCNAESGSALLRPLKAYNDFAKLFNCQVYAPERPFWKQELELGSGVKLRIHGLTSTLLSGAGERDVTRGHLYLSPLQTELDPLDDTVNLVLCHHPPDWLLDHDDVEDKVCNRAAIQLFGHKHRQRFTFDPRYARFSAGAVNPDRYEPGWSPGYNLIRIVVSGSGSQRAIHIEAHLRQWQDNPERFRAIVTRTGGEVFHHDIFIPDHRAEATRANASAGDAAGAPPGHTSLAQAEADVEIVMSDERTRNLVFRFWNLKISQRKEIAQELGLLEADELTLPESERYGRALRRAGERNLVDRLANEIARREGTNGTR